MRLYRSFVIALGTLIAISLSAQGQVYYPPPGESLAQQDVRTPAEVGMDPGVIAALQGWASRWALWRHGYLVHVEGDFNLTQGVKSLRKTFHAVTVGAALQQARIPSLDQKVSVWQTQLVGNDADATWFHVLTQSAGFDYPGCGDPTDHAPGSMWTYSDLNPLHLNDALAKVYGKAGYQDDYGDVLRQSYFDAIGMQGWSSSVSNDGIRLSLDLEDMGRLGLLMVRFGAWDGVRVAPMWFIHQMDTPETSGMAVNYAGCNDGTFPFTHLGLTAQEFPESPYGYMTWVNGGVPLFPGAAPGWAFGASANGAYLLWNRGNGLVFAGFGSQLGTPDDQVPYILEDHIAGINPLLRRPACGLGFELTLLLPPLAWLHASRSRSFKRRN